MESLLDIMYLKRFCLPSTSNIDNIREHKQMDTNMCKCGNYNHIACVFKSSSEKSGIPNKINIISFGVNKYKDVGGLEPTIHAEIDVLSKLPTIKNKKLTHINILVVRFTKYRQIVASKPCHDCVNTMNKLPESKGYKLHRIYYSDSYGNVVRTNLRDLKKESPHYTRRYRETMRRGDNVFL